MVAIYLTDYDKPGLTFVGTDLPAFGSTPSCFGLYINNVWLFNMSYEFLFARRLVLSYSTASWFRPDSEVTDCTLAEGRKRVVKPLLRPPLITGATELYQPILPRHLSEGGAARLYDNAYARSLYIDSTNRRGKILDASGAAYSSEASGLWAPDIMWDFRIIKHRLAVQTLRWQVELLHRAPSFRRLPREEQNTFLSVHMFGSFDSYDAAGGHTDKGRDDQRKPILGSINE